MTHVDEQLTMRFGAALAMQYALLGQPNPVFERLERHRDVPGDTGPERFVLAVPGSTGRRRPGRTTGGESGEEKEAFHAASVSASRSCNLTSALLSARSLLAQQALRRDEPCEEARALALQALAGGRLLEEESGHSYSFYLAASALIDA